MNPLEYRTFISEPVPMSLPDTPSGPALTSPITTTVIYGDHDAVLVDPPITIAQAEAISDWVAGLNRNLRYIVSTHGHADHWFGTAPIMHRFPGARSIATAATIEVMKFQASPGFKAQTYEAMLPAQIPETPVVAETVELGTFELEGKNISLIEVGRSDTDNTSVVHVPSIGLVVAGDVVYNGVHQYLVESTGPNDIDDWLASIKKIEALTPQVVIAGHKNFQLDDAPERVINSTREYLETARRMIRSSTDPAGYVEEMIAAFPTWLNRPMLWMSAQAIDASRT